MCSHSHLGSVDQPACLHACLYCRLAVEFWPNLLLTALMKNYEQNKTVCLFWFLLLQWRSIYDCMCYVLDVLICLSIHGCICWYFLNCCPDSGSVASPDMLAASATRECVDIEINIGNLQRLYLFLGMRVENGCGISRKCKLTKKSWLFISKNSI